MLRVMLVMNDGSLLTGRHQQHHTQILLKIEIKERGFLGFCKKHQTLAVSVILNFELHVYNNSLAPNLLPLAPIPLPLAPCSLPLAPIPLTPCP